MTDAVKSAILAAYPFAQLAVVRAFKASTRNDNWLVEDGRGRRYVLRRNLQHAHVQRIAFQVRFQQHLRHHGFPTAEVVEMRRRMVSILVAATGQSEERITADIDRDYIVRGDEAVAYGLVDHVIDQRELADLTRAAA